VLFVSGTRDALAPQEGLTAAARKVRGGRSFHWIDTADHGYRPLKSSGQTIEGVLAEVGAIATEWVTRLPNS
jgi:predicted alpha/beta-hydrolase family hydrolase